MLNFSKCWNTFKGGTRCHKLVYKAYRRQLCLPWILANELRLHLAQYIYILKCPLVIKRWQWKIYGLKVLFPLKTYILGAFHGHVCRRVAVTAWANSHPVWRRPWPKLRLHWRSKCWSLREIIQSILSPTKSYEVLRSPTKSYEVLWNPTNSCYVPQTPTT